MFDFQHSYAQLPEQAHARLDPEPVAAPRLVAFNHALAAEMGAEGLPEEAALAAWFSGNQLPAGAHPLALAYAGHQFGHFVPQLGDGRALLLGEVVDLSGRRRDVQLKGSGITPFSRGGDGRAALGPVLREYLMSEAMHALGIPTTRALAAVTTGEPVFRDTALPGAVFTRVAASHVRVGTFQYFAARQDFASLRALADHVIGRHHPAAGAAEERYAALLEAVVEAQAALVARWLGVGFIHGVMNTDNMTVSGETIDYGPCAFMDSYDPATVFSSIDRNGRYAYANQPPIAQWNLARLAEALLPLVDEVPAAAVERVTPVVQGFAARFERHWLAVMRAKLGLASEEVEDAELAQALLDRMQAEGLDFTVTFRSLAAAADGGEVPAGLDGWCDDWRARLGRDALAPAERAAAMQRANPAVIPRNYRVEEALAAAVERDDFGPFERLRAALARPFAASAEAEAFLAPPAERDPYYRTFCGT